MIKKRYLTFIGIILVIILAIVTVFNAVLLRPVSVSELPGIRLTSVQESVTSTSLTYTITNETDSIIRYSPEYSIEKKNIWGWRKLLRNPFTSSHPVQYIVTSHSYRNANVSWENTYGNLSSGTYRFVKTFSVGEEEYTIAAEFTIP